MRLIILSLVIVYVCEAYKILVIFPFPTKSHAALGNGVVRHLLNAGHEVTYITPYPFSKNSNTTNIREIVISENIKYVIESVKSMNSKLNMPQRNNEVLSSTGALDVCFKVGKSTLENYNVQQLINDPKETFDAVIVEWLFTEIYSGLGTLFDCPFIWVNSFVFNYSNRRLIAETVSPAYASSSNLPPLTFLQRIKALWMDLETAIYLKFVIDPKVEVLNRKLLEPAFLIRGKQMPSFNELFYNVSLILNAFHNSFGQSINLPANCIDIGGYHIDTPTKPLPKDLQKLMDNAKHGVIYFSLGSNLKSENLPRKIREDLLKVFGALKETVIWKFEEVLPVLPANVHILPWAPQQSILAHPKCVLFITHGGLLSTMETIYFGVPIIGIPIYLDQFANIDAVIGKGIGKRIDLNFEAPKHLKKAIHEMINDSKYRVKAKELSSIFHDRLAPPGVELVYWVEHVVRTRGAPHLRSPRLMIPWYQKMYLDFAALFVVIILIAYSFKRYIHCKRKVIKEGKNKNK